MLTQLIINLFSWGGGIYYSLWNNLCKFGVVTLIHTLQHRQANMILFLSVLNLGLMSTSKHQTAFTSMAAAVRSIEKWQELGHQLNINPEKLSNLFNSGRSGAECRDEMIAYWEKHDDDASWEKLGRALARMGENQLAERIIKERGVGGRAVTCATPTQNNQPTFANTEASNSTLRVMHANMHYTIIHSAQQS